MRTAPAAIGLTLALAVNATPADAAARAETRAHLRPHHPQARHPQARRSQARRARAPHRRRRGPSPAASAGLAPMEIVPAPLALPPPHPASPWGAPLPDARLGAVDAAPEGGPAGRELRGTLHGQAQPDSQAVQLAPIPPPTVQPPAPGFPR